MYTTTPGLGMYSSTEIYDDNSDIKLDAAGDDGEEEDKVKETNDTNEAVLADSSSSSHQFGLESSLWVAFSILVVAVIISIIIVAVYSYRRRKTQKSKDLSAVAVNGSAAPAAASEGAVELRESPIRNSPPRDSATFKDAAYDI